MKIYVLALLGLMLMLMNPLTQAQVHPCSGPGQNEVVVGQTEASNGVAPVPLCRTTNGEESTHSDAPVLHWESRWGAIATDASQGVVGSVTNMSSQRAAERGAMDDCKTKGGVTCKLQLPYKNACTAMVVGDTKFNVSVDKTTEAAGQAAIDGCKEQSTNCHVYFTACSPAALVR